MGRTADACSVFELGTLDRCIVADQQFGLDPANTGHWSKALDQIQEERSSFLVQYLLH